MYKLLFVVLPTGMEADEKLYNKLVEGYRMDRPEYATKDV